MGLCGQLAGRKRKGEKKKASPRKDGVGCGSQEGLVFSTSPETGRKCGELAPGWPRLALASAQLIAQQLVSLFLLHNLSNLMVPIFKPGMTVIPTSRMLIPVNA